MGLLCEFGQWGCCEFGKWGCCVSLVSGVDCVSLVSGVVPKN